MLVRTGVRQLEISKTGDEIGWIKASASSECFLFHLVSLPL